jgi:hypothetical protein
MKTMASRKHHRTLWNIAILVQICVQTNLFTQEQSTSHLREQYKREQADLEALRRIVRSLNSVDSTYEAYFPTWLVLDQTLRLKAMDVFRSRGIAVSENDDVVIVATPDSQDVVDIRIGESNYGRLYARSALDRTIKQELLRPQSYVSDERTPTGYSRSDSETRKAFARPISPDWISASVSLFGGEIRFANDWSLIGKVGDDVLGYPFWSSGQVWLMIRYKSVALGGRLPVHGGLDDFTLGFRTRRLNGSTGVCGEFEIEWDAIRIDSRNFTYGGLGGSFAIGTLGDRRPELVTPDPNKLYSIPSLLELHYSFDYQFNRSGQLLSAQVGISYHNVTTSKFRELEVIRIGEPESFVHPHIVLVYTHQRADWFKVSGQLSRLSLLSAWVELVPRFVFAEVKYSSVLFREHRSWEHSSYFYATIGINFDF